MTRLERELRRQERRRLGKINRNESGVLTAVIKLVLMMLAIIIGITVWFWAAGQQAELEAQAAVLRHHRITASSLTDIPVVEPLPLTPPEDGEPPQAIEVKMATKADAIPEERWESLGRWKLTAYCPLECCNGRGRAWKTASGRPMVVGDTVATARLPFGTKLKIRDKVYTVSDRGVPYGHVDILHESHSAARKFGVQYAEVFILR